jgi:hypothetical protein
MMDWVAVRCCCQPTRIFGFLRLERDHGPTVTVTDVFGAQQVLELKRYCAGGGFINDERAIYSDDRPIEFWRSIPGFVEARPPAPHRLEPLPSAADIRTIFAREGR